MANPEHANPELHGLVAIVTGAASGIGLATAMLMADRGASVIGLDLTSVPNANGVEFIRADVTDQTSVDAAIARVAETMGGLDIVVNNAGIGAVGDVTENDDDEWRRLYDVNVLGTVRVMRAATPLLRQSSHATVVNVASIAATAGLPSRACYSATKGAILSLTLAMAADFVGAGIRVNAVAPGTVDTPWVGRLLAHTGNPEDTRRQLEARQPLGRLGAPEEVAAAIAYLASPAATFTTGTCLAVDGGMAGLRMPGRST